MTSFQVEDSFFCINTAPCPYDEASRETFADDSGLYREWTESLLAHLCDIGES